MAKNRKQKRLIIRSVVAWIIAVSLVIILFPVTLLIWIIVYPFDRKKYIIHRLLIWQSVILCKALPIWKIHITGREKAVKGTTYVMISNHQSLIDILIINCLGLRFRWVSKIENTRVPVLGWYMKMADYIIVDRGDDESKAAMLEKSLKWLVNGVSVMIFPEGTRSKDQETGFFKRGAFQLAIDARVPILPMVIDGAGDILPKHGFFIKGNNKITLRVLDPVPPSAFNTKNPEELALKFRELINTNLNELRKDGL